MRKTKNNKNKIECHTITFENLSLTNILDLDRAPRNAAPGKGPTLSSLKRGSSKKRQHK